VRVPAGHGAGRSNPRRTRRLRVEFVPPAQRRVKRRPHPLSALRLGRPAAHPSPISVQVGGAAQRRGTGPPSSTYATVGRGQFALSPIASVGFLPCCWVLVALTAGDRSRSRRAGTSLRYAAASRSAVAPLLRQKTDRALAFSFVANLILPAWSVPLGASSSAGPRPRSPVGGTFETSTTLQRSCDRLWPTAPCFARRGPAASIR